MMVLWLCCWPASHVVLMPAASELSLKLLNTFTVSLAGITVVLVLAFAIPGTYCTCICRNPTLLCMKLPELGMQTG